MEVITAKKVNPVIEGNHKCPPVAVQMTEGGKGARGEQGQG